VTPGEVRVDVGQPSRTAENAAIMRALHQALPSEARVFDDPLATRMVVPDSDAYRSRVALLERLPKPLRARFTHYLLRARYAEDCLADAVQQRSLGQFVILGGGLDTFPYRQPGWAASLRIFEVDHPATQAWKRQRVQQAGIAEPANLHFAPVDFVDTTLAAGLSRAGFSDTVPTFFSMLGVSQYLTLDDLDRTFGFVYGMPPGSEIVFTIAVPDDMLQPDEVEFVTALTKRFAEIGEPWHTRMRPEAFTARLRDMGFSVITYLTPEEANARYFRNRTDGLRASEQELAMRAVV
jgi:methyltransferase (TIGR00027 family)